MFYNDDDMESCELQVILSAATANVFSVSRKLHNEGLENKNILKSVLCRAAILQSGMICPCLLHSTESQIAF